MRRDLQRRLERLEWRQDEVGIPLFIVITHTIDDQRRIALGSGEHIVLDWYNNLNGHILARERVSSDFADQGRRCETLQGRLGSGSLYGPVPPIVIQLSGSREQPNSRGLGCPPPTQFLVR